jgi:hypothetical protein
MQAGVSKGGKRVRGSCTGLVLLCNSDAVSLPLVWSAAAAACAQAGHAASLLLQVQVGCGLSGNTGVANLTLSSSNLLINCMLQVMLQVQVFFLRTTGYFDCVCFWCRIQSDKEFPRTL